MERYGLPQARPPAARGAPDGLRRHPLAHRARRDHAEAEHRAADRAHGRVRRRHARSRPTSSSTAPATRSPSRSSTRTSSRRPTTSCRSTGACSTRRSAASTSSRCCSRSGRPCRSPRRSREWVCDHLAGRYALPPEQRDAGRHRARAPRRCQALRRLQAPHDAGRLRRLPARPRARAQGRRGAAAAPGTACRYRRARRPPNPHDGAGRGGRGERTKAANRAAILAAAQGVFAEPATARPACATSCAAPSSPRARSTTTSRTRQSIFRALVEEVGGEAAPAGARGAPRGARRGGVRRARAYRAYFAFIVEDPATFAFVRAQRRDDPRGVRRRRRSPAGHDELREDLEAAIAAGALPPRSTSTTARTR